MGRKGVVLKWRKEVASYLRRAMLNLRRKAFYTLIMVHAESRSW